MGLEIVEFALAIEKRFDLDLPDSVMATMTTTRHMIDYLIGRLNAVPLAPYCRSQHVFYRIRSELVAANVPRASVTPRARVDWLVQGGPHRTVRELVSNVIRTSPSLRLMRDRHWPRDAVKRIVYKIALDEWALAGFSEDAHWTRDLGLG